MPAPKNGRQVKRNPRTLNLNVTPSPKSRTVVTKTHRVIAKGPPAPLKRQPKVTSSLFRPMLQLQGFKYDKDKYPIFKDSSGKKLTPHPELLYPTPPNPPYIPTQPLRYKPQYQQQRSLSTRQQRDASRTAGAAMPSTISPPINPHEDFDYDIPKSLSAQPQSELAEALSFGRSSLDSHRATSSSSSSATRTDGKSRSQSPTTTQRQSYSTPVNPPTIEPTKLSTKAPSLTNIEKHNLDAIQAQQQLNTTRQAHEQQRIRRGSLPESGAMSRYTFHGPGAYLSDNEGDIFRSSNASSMGTPSRLNKIPPSASRESGSSATLGGIDSIVDSLEIPKVPPRDFQTHPLPPRSDGMTRPTQRYEQPFGYNHGLEAQPSTQLKSTRDVNMVDDLSLQEANRQARMQKVIDQAYVAEDALLADHLRLKSEKKHSRRGRKRGDKPRSGTILESPIGERTARVLSNILNLDGDIEYYTNQAREARLKREAEAANRINNDNMTAASLKDHDPALKLAWSKPIVRPTSLPTRPDWFASSSSDHDGFQTAGSVGKGIDTPFLPSSKQSSSTDRGFFPRQPQTLSSNLNPKLDPLTTASKKYYQPPSPSSPSSSSLSLASPTFKLSSSQPLSQQQPTQLHSSPLDSFLSPASRTEHERFATGMDDTTLSGSFYGFGPGEVTLAPILPSPPIASATLFGGVRDNFINPIEANQQQLRSNKAKAQMGMGSEYPDYYNNRGFVGDYDTAAFSPSSSSRNDDEKSDHKLPSPTLTPPAQLNSKSNLPPTDGAGFAPTEDRDKKKRK